jgi:hypothetical protein
MLADNPNPLAIEVLAAREAIADHLAANDGGGGRFPKGHSPGN